MLCVCHTPPLSRPRPSVQPSAVCLPLGALPSPRLRHPRGARCRPLRPSLPWRPGASFPPRRGDSRSGRRRLRRPLPLLLLPPPRLLGLSAPRNRPPRAALWTCSPRRPGPVGRPRVAPSYFSPATAFPSQLSTCLPEVNFQKQESPELGQGDEPRGSSREESGGDVHSAEGPSAAHAAENGIKSDGQRGGVPAHLCGGGQQPAQPAATALYRPGCRGRGDGIFQVGDGGPEAVTANPLEHPGSCQGPRDLCGSSAS